MSNTIRSALAAVLATALICTTTTLRPCALQLPAGSPEESTEQKRTAKIKAEVNKRGVGASARVKLKLWDKHELQGRITQIEEESFQILIDPDWLDIQPAKDRLVTIRYAEVEKFRGPRSHWSSLWR